MASLKKTLKKSLKKAFNEISTRFASEIVSALAHVGVEELRDALAGLRGERQASKNPRGSSKRSKPTATTSHSIEMGAATLVRHLKDHGPSRSEDLRRALGFSREDMGRVFALAMERKLVTKTGEKRATVYEAVKRRGSKPQLTG
jgi:hypothetical protein